VTQAYQTLSREIFVECGNVKPQWRCSA